MTLLTALLGFDRLDDVLVSDEVFSFTLGLPSPTPDLWSFLNVTAQVGVTDGVVRTLGPTGAAVLVVGTVLRSVLGAGLLGLAVLYVAYGTPFIAVTHDYGFRRALARSVSLSGTGPYVAFTVGYALTVLACSPVVSALAYADGVPGVLLAAVVAAPVGTVLAGAATSFFASVAE